jgi:hypothetical protein
MSTGRAGITAIEANPGWCSDAGAADDRSGGPLVVKYSFDPIRPACLVLFALALLCGCTHQKSAQPTMQKGNGAIKGRLLNNQAEPFDLSLAGDTGAKALKIELISSLSGVFATTTPGPNKSEFVFDNVPPGRYELSVYTVVPDKRTIAGSQTVTVDPDQTASATLTLQVTEQK